MRPLSKANQLKLRAMEAGFQNFEADAFRHCLARFEHAVRADEREHVQAICDELANNYESSIPPRHDLAGVIDELHATITNRRQNT